MAIRIRNLTCRVTVSKGRKSDTLQRGEQPARPSLAFTQPEPAPHGETGPEPSRTVTEARETAGEKRQRKASPDKADPRAVADRVYDLMKEEISLARLRGKPW